MTYASKVLSGSTGLIVASLGLIVSGVIRQKLAVSRYGPEVLAVFGQATLMQGIISIFLGAGLVLAARAVLSDGTLDPSVRRAAGSWLLRRPMLLSVLVVPLSWVAGPFASRLYTGESEWALAFALAGLGSVVLLSQQSALAISQILGSARGFVLSAGLAAVAASLVTTALMLSGSLTAAFATFVLSPLASLGAILLASRSVRSLWGVRPRLERSQGLRAARIATASTLVGLAALVIQSYLSARLVRVESLEAVALLQPSVLVVAAASVVTSAVTATVMQHRNESESADSLIRSKGPWREALLLSALMCLLAGLSLPFVPLGIELFYSDGLRSASPLVGMQLSAEVLNALAWVGGSMLVPTGLLRLWMFANVASLASKLAVGAVALEPLGVAAIPLSSIVQAAVGVVVLFGLVQPRLSARMAMVLGGVVIGSGLIAVVWLAYPIPNVEAMLGSVGFGLAVTLLILRDLRSPRVAQGGIRIPND